jgi:hypothetical protein
VLEIDYKTQDWPNIDDLICAKDLIVIDQRIYAREIITDQDVISSDLNNQASYRSDGINDTPTSSINALE